MGTVEPLQLTLDDSYITATLELLKKAIQEILRRNNSRFSLNEHYYNAYTLVLHKHGDKLYEMLKKAIKEHLWTKVRTIVVEAINGSFLVTLNHVWTDHAFSMVIIRDILMYLDRVYIPYANVESVYALGLRIFRNEIVDYPIVKEQLKTAPFKMITMDMERQTDIDWTDWKNVCRMLIDLGGGNRDYYEQQFETRFLREAGEFYRRTGQKFLAENNACVYVCKVNKFLKEEAQRSKERNLDGITEQKLIMVLNEELITKNMATIMEMDNSGLVHMLSNDRFDDLYDLHEFLKRVPNGSKTMANALSRYLRTKGAAMVSEGEAADGNGANISNPINYIQDLIKLKKEFDRLLSDAFNNDSHLKHCIHSNFEHFLNISQKAPEFLFLYIDDKLKKGLRADLDEGEVEVALDAAIELFPFLQEKDVFEKCYRQHLAKRFLQQKNLSDDADFFVDHYDKYVISKLKAECGCQFTSKLEGMIRDKKLSRALMNEYRERETDNQTDLDLSVCVLTSGFWPINQQAPLCTLPQSVEQAFRHFERVYLGKHNGRKITLNPELGYADVKALFYPNRSSRPVSMKINEQKHLESQQEGEMPGSSSFRPREEQKILTVSTYQTCLLICFNQHAKMTYEQLLDMTKIPDWHLKRCLQSLAMGKQSQRILCHVKGTGKNIEPDDEFCVNDGFNSKLTRIKIQMAYGSSEMEFERKKMQSRIDDDDRKHEIEAAIIRVMKGRKKLLHNDLVIEVTNQLKSHFVPNPVFIKQRVESLIEREFLERDKSDLKLFVYIA